MKKWAKHIGTNEGVETVFCIQNLILTNNPMKSQCRSRSRATKSDLKNGFSPMKGRGKSGFESSSMHILKVFSLMYGYFSLFHSNCLWSIVILLCSLLFFFLNCCYFFNSFGYIAIYTNMILYLQIVFISHSFYHF